MTRNDELVLGVDLDGVCADYESAFRSSYASHAGIDPVQLPAQTTLDAFSQWGLSFAEFEEAHRRAVLQDRIFRTMAAVDGVSEGLWELSDNGVWIRIITHRLLFNGSHEIAAADTAAWLDANDIPYRDLCFIGDKPNVGADVYVDDAPSNVLSLRATGKPVLVFDQPYNRRLPAPRAHHWHDVVAFVDAELARRDRQLPLPLT